MSRTRMITVFTSMNVRFNEKAFSLTQHVK